MSFEITGEYNTATVQTNVSRDEAEDEAVEQIQQMMDHKAFAGDDDVAIMPDFHWGAGAVIGFTMPVKNRVVPNTIGVDIGCGMYAVNFGQIDVEQDETELLELDEAVRDRIPMGFDVHSRNSYHILNDFPWRECRLKAVDFDASTDFDLPAPDTLYDESYFENLCQKVGYDQTRAINSLGTLGGGNHFIEFGTDSEDNVWCILHSGSRGIGAEIAQYWQDIATEKTFQRNATVEIPADEAVYFGYDTDEPVTATPADLVIDREAVLNDYEGEAIEGKFGQLKSYMNAGKGDSSPLDYLEGDEATGYIIDMIFAQTYASESRKQMLKRVEAALIDCGYDVRSGLWRTGIESVHNYIDFDDATIRKGSCRAHEDEQLVVPFNMSYGTIIARGKGQDDWNKSSAHGAGRAMSRTGAEDQFDQDDFDEQIGDVVMSKQPLDEIPGAYKPAEQVEQALGESVVIEDRIVPFLSIKAE